MLQTYHKTHYQFLLQIRKIMALSSAFIALLTPPPPSPLILKRFAFEEREFHLLTEIISCQVTIKGRDRKFLKAMQKVVGIRRFLSPIIPEILGRRSFVIHHFYSKANHHRKYKTPKSKRFFYVKRLTSGEKTHA